MRVLQINATYGVGSTGVIVKEISNVLDSENIENWVACQYINEQNGKVFGISSRQDMKIHAMLSRLTGTNACFSKSATRKLINKIEQIQPTVVHLHNLHNNYINLSMLLSFLGERNIKTVVTLHDCWFFTGKCTHFTHDGCSKWMSGCGGCPRIKRDIPSWFFDRTAEMLETKKKLFKGIHQLEVVGCSKWISQLAEKSILSDGKFTIIHNGINLRIFQEIGADFRKEKRIQDKFVILGMANKWLSEDNKGLLEFVRSKLGAQYHIVIIGADCEDKEGISYIPTINDQSEMAAWYRSSDVFVNVTHEDTLPTVNIEAMACGTPVVTFDVCGSPETITNDTGIIVAENDWYELIHAIKTIKENGKKTYSSACRQHVGNEYNSEIQFRKYLSIYEKNPVK